MAAGLELAFESAAFICSTVSKGIPVSADPYKPRTGALRSAAISTGCLGLLAVLSPTKRPYQATPAFTSGIVADNHVIRPPQQNPVTATFFRSPPFFPAQAIAALRSPKTCGSGVLATILLWISATVPNEFGSLWVNFNSPLLWDVFAISTYLSVSLVFWWTGLLPDFAMIRDRAVKPFQKKIYSLVSFGWTGRAKDWQRFEEVSLVLAGLATPLVLSVHTIVSFDFATSVIPGWHTTIFHLIL